MSAIKDKSFLPYSARIAMKGLSQDADSLSNLRTQATSGKRYISYDSNPDSAARTLNMSNVDKRNNQYLININDASVKISTVTMMHERVLEKATAFSARLVGALNSGTNDPNLQSYASSLIDEVVQYLNATDQNGNYLFAGNNISKTPVDKTVIGVDPNLAPYYQGDNISLAVTIDDSGNAKKYGISADADGYKQLLAAFKIVANPSSTESDWRNALGTVETAHNNLISDYAILGNQAADMESTNETINAIKQDNEIAKKTITDADQLQVMLETKMLEHKQQISFMITVSIIKGPKLIDFVK